MNDQRFRPYYLCTCLGVLAASVYPLYMGIKVVWDMLADGVVLKENYPKYIIPYTPISMALLVGVLLMPVFIRFMKKYALIGGAALSVGTFFGLEMLFENKIIIESLNSAVKLEDWQMYMCYIPSASLQTSYKTQTAVDILMGDYNPAFKLHFYLISVLLILALLNCFYGFGELVRSGDKKRLGSLIAQSVSAALFLGLCVLACFTAFWRDGNIRVSPLSAFLMAAFFILFGITAGVFAGSLLNRKSRSLSVLIPAVVSSVVTTLMYVGEMILLNGHLYRFGEGFLFDPLSGIILAPMDIMIILLSGVITAFLMRILQYDRWKKLRKE